MDIDLYIMSRKASLNMVYWSIKLSLEDIEKKHPNRTDLIESMTRHMISTLEAVECMKFLEDNWRSDSRRNYQLERLNAELLIEVAELKNKNNQLMDRVNI